MQYLKENQLLVNNDVKGREKKYGWLFVVTICPIQITLQIDCFSMICKYFSCE